MRTSFRCQILALLLLPLTAIAQGASVTDILGGGSSSGCGVTMSCPPSPGGGTDPHNCTGNGAGNPCSADSGPATQSSSTPQDVGGGNPINLLSGNKYQKEVDMPALPGVLGLEIVRHYNSRFSHPNSPKGIFGRGWKLSYETDLYISSRTLQVLQADGSRIIFPRDPANPSLCATDDPARGQIVVDRLPGGEAYTWVWPDGRKLLFNHLGRLVQIIAPTGEALQLVRDQDGQLVKVIDPQGRSLSLAYYGRQSPGAFLGVRTIDSPVGRYTYAYGSSLPASSEASPALAVANLASVLRPGAYDSAQPAHPYANRGVTTAALTRHYHYEDARYPTLLTGISLRGAGGDGKVVDRRLVTWAYDAAGRAVRSVKGEAPADEAFGIEEIRLDFSRPGRTVLTNSLGQKTVYLTGWVDGELRLLEARGPGCASCGPTDLRYAYDARGRVVVTTRLDREGKPRLSELTSFDAVGRPRILRTVAFPLGKPREVAWVRYAYGPDRAHRLPGQAAPLALPDPRPSAIARPSVVAGREHRWEFAYNEAGQPTRVRETGYAPAAGSNAPPAPLERVTAFAYETVNGRSLLVAVDGPLPNGPADSPADSDITRVQWDAKGNFIVGTTAPGDLRNTLAYDQAGLIERIGNDAGLSTEFLHDPRLNPVQISRKGPGRETLVERYERDVWETPTQISAGTPDKLRPILAQANDDAGRLAWRANALGMLQTRQYDSESHLVGQALRNGHQARIHRYRHDDKGNLVGWSDNAGHGSHLRYDDSGRPTAYIDASGREIEPFPTPPATGHRRDDFGRIVASRHPDSGASTREFDAADRLVAMRDAAGNRASYEYDVQGRIARQTVTDAKSGTEIVTAWRYEGRHLVEIVHPGQRERYTYDERGWQTARIVTLQTPQGEHTAVTRYEHDGEGRLIATVLPDGSRLEYRRNGQEQVVALVRNPVRTAWLRWLGREQVIVKNLTRDLIGLAGYTTGNGIDAQYQRSREGELARIAYRHTRSRPTLASLPGISAAHAQTAPQPSEPVAPAAPTQLPGALGLPADPQALLDHRYLWDVQGNLLYQRQTGVLHQLSIQRSNAYDTRDRLIASVDSREGGEERAVWRYAYDRHQRRLLSQQDAPNQRDLATGTQRSAYFPGSHRRQGADYTANGQPAKRAEREYDWDALGRLDEVRQAGQTLARYAYDHRGLRNAKTTGGETTHYLYDEARQPLAELDAQGKLSRQYIYLADTALALIDTPEGAALAPAEQNALARFAGDLLRIAQSWFADDGDLVWLHTNHLGAPEAATDARGRLRWRADYAPFGAAAVHARDGFILNLRLPGQYADAETGLYYNRQRYYDPEQGEYLTPDPLGTPNGPNPYAYVAFNPLRFIDPDGLVLFAFDGTGNSDDFNDPAMNGSGMSNVVYFRDAYDSGNRNYISGVGTVHRDTEYGDIRPEDYATHTLLWWLTPGDPVYVNDMGGNYSGPARIDRMMFYIRDEATNFENDEAMDIDIIGFSRGAAEAREFANRIVASSVMIDGKTYYKYTDRDGQAACQWVNFRFMGLFDTVLSTNFSGTGYNLRIPSEFAYVAQAVALNEYRSGSLSVFSERNPRPHGMHWGGFPLESIGADNNTPGQIRIERGFIGAHADIGGGYPDNEQGLSQIALHWMVEQARNAGVNLKPIDPIPLGNPVIHDQSNAILVGDPRKLAPRQVTIGDQAQTVYAHAEDREVKGTVSGNRQREMGFSGNSMTHEDTYNYITWTPRDAEQTGKDTPLDPRKLGSITGTVDMEGYLKWLREHGYGI